MALSLQQQLQHQINTQVSAIANLLDNKAITELLPSKQLIKIEAALEHLNQLLQRQSTAVATQTNANNIYFINNTKTDYPEINNDRLDKSSLPHDWSIETITLAELIKLPHPIKAIILVNNSRAEQDQQLQQLRHHNYSQHAYIWVNHASDYSEQLADQLLISPLIDINLTPLFEFMARLEQVATLFDTNIETKLAKYLWLHQKLTLEPLLDISHPQIFHYPILSAWQLSLDQSQHCLANLCKDQVLSQQQLLSRQRFCSHCQSGHLNYIDLCPECFNLDISLQTSLHCFNCGHVDKQQRFTQDQQLQCPNCQQRLRHIGVDYDRPIESYQCNQCLTLFNDAVVKAVCLSCHTENELDNLTKYNFYQYQLTQFTQPYLLNQTQSNVQYQVEQKTMDFNHFCWLVEWQNNLAIRHHLSHVLLVCKLNQAYEQSSKQQQQQLITALQARLANELRDTDACCQFTGAGLFLLLPFTDEPQAQKVVQKLLSFKDSHNQPLAISSRLFPLPTKIEGNIKQWLNDKLTLTGAT